ncbi:hypothetical protein M5K25_012440 [Dendrobium thyrsiflorum]|uniref:RRM domain-containing protein n=1 Tax=Dendrobium thyrsiflorum TaxID=117978 RepID=A0ABD0UXG7_DENTH
MAKALAVARAGFRRLFSISAFTPPPPATVPPPAEPSPNLFVSGKCIPNVEREERDSPFQAVEELGIFLVQPWGELAISTATILIFTSSGSALIHMSSSIKTCTYPNTAFCGDGPKTLMTGADGGGMDDGPDQDLMVPSSRAIVVPGFDAIGEHTGAGHNHNIVIPFGGKSPDIGYFGAYILAFYKDFPTCSWAKHLWFKGNALRYSVFAWLCIAGGLKTAAALSLRNVYISPLCPLCHLDIESVNHLFFECNFSFAVLTKLIPKASALLLRPTATQLFDWTEELNLPERGHSLFKLCICCVIYHVWKERNSRRFGGQSICPVTLYHCIQRSVRAKVLKWKNGDKRCCCFRVLSASSFIIAGVCSILLLTSAILLLWPSNPELSVVRLCLNRFRGTPLPSISIHFAMGLEIKIHNPEFFLRLTIAQFSPTSSTVGSCLDLLPLLVGLSKRTTSEGLREAFSKFGNVVQARVVTDRVSGYSKGFGFVRYGTIEEAAEGIKGMDGKFLDGWVIFAEHAKPRPPPPSQAQSSQPPLNVSSSPPINYTTQTTQSWSSYQSTQASEPLPSHSNHTLQETQTPSNYSYHSAQTLHSPASYNSVPPPPSSFASVQASNYSQDSESQLGYSGPPSTYAPEASQPPNYQQSSHDSAPTFNLPPHYSNPEDLSSQSSSHQHQQTEYESSTSK